MSLNIQLDTQGIASTLRALRKIDPELNRAMLREIKNAAVPMVDAARANVPIDPPLSGMASNWRQGSLSWTPSIRRGVKARVSTARKRTRKGKVRVRLLSIVMPRGIGEVFDMAGRNGSNSQLVQQLNKRYGPASRAMYKNQELARRKTEEALEIAVGKLSVVINRYVGKV